MAMTFLDVCNRLDKIIEMMRVKVNHCIVCQKPIPDGFTACNDCYAKQQENSFTKGELFSCCRCHLLYRIDKDNPTHYCSKCRPIVQTDTEKIKGYFEGGLVQGGLTKKDLFDCKKCNKIFELSNGSQLFCSKLCEKKQTFDCLKCQTRFFIPGGEDTKKCPTCSLPFEKLQIEKIAKSTIYCDRCKLEYVFVEREPDATCPVCAYDWLNK